MSAAPGDDAAERPLILCLHGFPDHPPSLAPFMAHLAAAGYRVVAPWMRGYQPSMAAGPFHAEQLGRDVIALADALSPSRPVALVGHDWGAVATYAALALAPARVAAAVTMAIPHPLAFTRALASPRQLVRSSYMLMFQLPALPERALIARDGALIRRIWRAWSPGYTSPPERHRALVACLAASMPAPLAYYRALVQPPRAALARFRAVSTQIAAIATPTLSLHGTTDGCFDHRLCRGQERYFRGPYRAELMSGVGHFMATEAPSACAAAVLPWLRQHAP